NQPGSFITGPLQRMSTTSFNLHLLGTTKIVGLKPICPKLSFLSNSNALRLKHAYERIESVIPINRRTCRFSKTEAKRVKGFNSRHPFIGTIHGKINVLIDDNAIL